ncbi:M20 aminoacylase family protein [uncultured Nisaea sp.]|mgnify:FL=1|uniref:M20 aminoacylase family protein n=1 Tax=uncultured Nisaea sp. TaxID=538215 RepID=UPI0030EF3E7D|tara:strand:+ start:2606 stop:3781 length:1176 start_codon:yes stop_codon:yes gene_type:complete
MPIKNRIAEFEGEMREWRHDFHMHPELCYEETRTAGIVAEKLRSWGIETHEGVGRTGVVGVIKGNGLGTRAIGIRADMDALPMQEVSNPEYKSTIPGKMHACGHDGHTSTLLGAAKYLAETRNFDGTVNLYFQPAEEGGAGARTMIEDGLFERFPCDAVYGLHNMPQLPKNTFGIRKGPLMAGADSVTITIKARGGHAAMPHMAIDPIAIGTQIYQAAQTFVSRSINPFDTAVVSITQFHAGTANNVIPGEAVLNASVRTMTKEVQALIREKFQKLCEGLALANGIEIECEYREGYPVTSNHDEQVERIISAAASVVGMEAVDPETEALMGSEDFSFMLEERPGAYIFLGGGDETHTHSVHHPEYDFNDETLTTGASLWAALVEAELPRAG